MHSSYISSAYLESLFGSPATELPFFSFDIYELLEKAKSVYPVLSDRRVALSIAPQPSLACITTETDIAHISLHAILNRADLPIEVMSFILGHELIHLIIKPRMVDGVMRSHPPEFFELEQATQRYHDLAWTWIFLALDKYLKRDREQECTFVKPKWRKSRALGWPSIQIASELSGNARPLEEAEGLL
jgi:hypothetical protein